MSAWHTGETSTARLPCKPLMTDLTTLDAYLSSEQSPENTMQLSDLDGFLTGVICSPEVIMPSEWLPCRYVRSCETSCFIALLGWEDDRR